MTSLFCYLRTYSLACMQIKVGHGWIKKVRSRQKISTTTFKTRRNILGLMNLDDIGIVTKEYVNNINAISVINFYNKIKGNYTDK